MSFVRNAAIAACLTTLAACSTTGPSTAPVTTAPAATPSAAPTATGLTTTSPNITATAAGRPSAAPPSSLDPAQSDAGIIGQVTLANDTSGGRDGSYVVIGHKADGSSCSYSFDGDEFIAVAWFDDAPDGQIFQFGVSVPATAIPAADGATQDVTDGRVSFDFVSASGIGTLYVGDSTQENSGSSTIDVTRAGKSLTFTFEGAIWTGAAFSGTMICAEASL